MQPSETAELVEKLEDAQMALGSMATNRFGVPFRDTVTAWLGKLGVVSEQVPGPTYYTLSHCLMSLPFVTWPGSPGLIRTTTGRQGKAC